MIHRDPRCVFVADSMAIAVVTATWLTDNGIPARVMDLMTLGGFEGLTAWLPGVSARGIEVWVDDPAQVAEAQELLAEHQAAVAQKAAQAQRQGPIEVLCEECGQRSTFPGSQYGTTQECPHCGEYLDVVDPDSLSTEADPPPEAEEPGEP
jgi:hypothetical protein